MFGRNLRASGYQAVGGLKSLMPSKDHVYLTWHDIKFTVPNKSKPVKEDPRQKKLQAHQSLSNSEMNVNNTVRSSSLMNSESTLTASNTMAKSGMQSQQPALAYGKRKQVLHGLTGCALPGQIMCIMGASGSGKTSLLNILGQRISLSKGGKMTGEVRVNDRVIHTSDFGKFGAFVQ